MSQFRNAILSYTRFTDLALATRLLLGYVKNSSITSQVGSVVQDERAI